MRSRILQRAQPGTAPERGRSLARSTHARQKIPGFSNDLFAIHALRPGTGRAPSGAVPGCALLQLAFSLMLVSVPIAFAQINDDHPNGMQFASSGCRPEGDSASRCVSVGEFTNQHLALCSAPAPTSDADPGLNYSMPPSEERGMAELSQPSLTSRDQLADPALTASPRGWRIGGAGVLNYTANNQRWRFVVGYAPDFGVLLEKFGDAHSFNLAWQYSLGKHKPASWAGIKTGSESIRPPAPR